MERELRVEIAEAEEPRERDHHPVDAGPHGRRDLDHGRVAVVECGDAQERREPRFAAGASRKWYTCTRQSPNVWGITGASPPITTTVSDGLWGRCEAPFGIGTVAPGPNSLVPGQHQRRRDGRFRG
jgi:hypothetical protein